MTTIMAEDRMAGIERKLDYIVEEIANLKRIRTHAEKLAEAPEIAQASKTALLDAKLLTAAMQQLESANDFIADVHPVIRDVYQKALAGCEVLEEKGYFAAATAGIRISDTFVSSLSIGDLKRGEAIAPQLIGFVRDLTRPEILQAVQEIMQAFGKVHGTITANKSVFEIVRDVNTPDARRGITILVEFLKIVGAASTSVGLTATHAPTTLER